MIQKSKLHNYQLHAVNHIHSVKKCGLFIEMGLGKAQPIHSSVKVPGGWVKMGDIKVGDKIETPDGNISFVNGVYPQGELDIYKIIFADGRYAECCADHLWNVSSSKKNSQIGVGKYCGVYIGTDTITTSEISKRLSQTKPIHIDLIVPNTKEKDTNLPLHPYVLGSLIADGGLTGKTITYTKGDKFIIDKLNSILESQCCRLRTTTREHHYVLSKLLKNNSDNPVKIALSTFNLMGKYSYEKHIPSEYLNSSYSQRIELLQGLMDGDGTHSSLPSTGGLSYSTSSYQLALDVQYLIRSIGGICKIGIKYPTYTYKGVKLKGRDNYNLLIRHKTPSIFFTLPRKKQLTNDNNQYAKTLKLRILSVEKIGSSECKCISIADKNKLYITDDFITTHNTTTTLTAIAELLDLGSINKILIVAPLRVANTVWKQEASNWEHTKHLKLSICTGQKTERKEALKLKHDILIVNYDNLPWLLDNTKDRYDMIVIDESQNAKNPSTKRFKTIKPLSWEVKYAVLLTGTPTPNTIIDLWGQIFLLDRGQRLFFSKEQFITKYFYQENAYTHELKPYSHSHKTISEKISDICLTLKAEDYLDLPDKIIINEMCTLDNETFEAYKTMEDDAIYELGNNKDITVLSATALSGKLCQFANGFLYDEDHRAHIVHTEKIKVLKEIIENNPDENFFISYNFKYDLEVLLRELPGSVVLDDSATTVEKWNKGQIKFLLAHNRTSGLNLQQGGRIIIWYSMTWSLGSYLQFNGRIHRQGQTEIVKIFHIIVKDTIDEKILNVLGNKDLVQTTLMNTLRLILK